VLYVTPTTPFRAVSSCHLEHAVSLLNNTAPRCCDILRAMPRQVGGVRGGLTLEKLASFDDVITDALVDKVSRSLAGARRLGRGRLGEQLD
jgi:hypothetical protein